MSRDPVLVTFAVREEAKPFLRAFAAVPHVRPLVTGMGARRARQSFLEAIRGTPPSAVLTCGFAGGLNPDLEHGTVVYDASRHFPVPWDLASAGAVPGTFLCLDRVVVDTGEKRRLREETGADAVEMESEAIRAECDECRIPSATVRVISDAAGDDMPLDFNQVLNDQMELDHARLALALARRPGKIAELWRFNRRIGSAADRLTEVLTRVLR